MEGEYHKLMKITVLTELKKEGYELYLEPLESPIESLDWDYYRPDLIGIITNQNLLEIVLVECETKPNFVNLEQKASKIKHTFKLQKQLNKKNRLKFLLAIPFGTLNKINHSKNRRLWDIWIINNKGNIIHKIPQLETTFST